MINLKGSPIKHVFGLWLICWVMIRCQIRKSKGLRCSRSDVWVENNYLVKEIDSFYSQYKTPSIALKNIPNGSTPGKTADIALPSLFGNDWMDKFGVCSEVLSEEAR